MGERENCIIDLSESSKAEINDWLVFFSALKEVKIVRCPQEQGWK